MASDANAATRVPDFDKGVQYWAQQPASDDGVLGGYGNLSQIDALSSRMFLLTVCQRLSTISKPGSKGTNETRPRRKRTRALDIGAGIGRVTANTLLPLVDSVDVVEPVEHFLNEGIRAAQKGEWRSLKKARADGQHKLVRFYKAGLQDFKPDAMAHDAPAATVGQVQELDEESRQEEAEEGYDVVWCQWCLGHLSDDKLVEWLKACKRALKKSASDAVIVVKENTTRTSDREYDEDDHSWTRSQEVFKEIFQKSGLKVIREERQNGFPDELFPVYMYALR